MKGHVRLQAPEGVFIIYHWTGGWKGTEDFVEGAIYFVPDFQGGLLVMNLERRGGASIMSSPFHKKIMDNLLTNKNR